MCPNVTWYRTEAMRTKVLEEKLYGRRWDPDYWDPELIENEEFLKSLPKTNPAFVKSVHLGEYLDYITYGKIVTGAKRKFSKRGVKYISPTTVQDYGVIHCKLPLFVKKDDIRNSKDKKPSRGDILLNRTGEGTIGRNTVFLLPSEDYTIGDHVNILRLAGLSPFWTSLFLCSRFGYKQVLRYINGVSGRVEISFTQIKKLIIPIPNDLDQKTAQANYLSFHRWLNKILQRDQFFDQEETVKTNFYQMVEDVEKLVVGELKHLNKISIQK